MQIMKFFRRLSLLFYNIVQIQ